MYEDAKNWNDQRLDFSLVLNLRAKQIDLGPLAIDCLIFGAQPGVCFV